MGGFLFCRCCPHSGAVTAIVSLLWSAAKLSLVTAALGGCPADRQGKVRGDIQTPSSHPAEGETRRFEANSLQWRVLRTFGSDVRRAARSIAPAAACR